MTAVRLTSLSHGAGCACKLGPDELAAVLQHLPQVSDPRMLVDAATRDDAAVFRWTDDRALVATVDFFAPLVDDPHDFGAIAAANALSDIYAMGGVPLLALNILAWPRSPDLFPLAGGVLEGAAETARQAGTVVGGGHSIDDPEPKFGMVVMGEVRPDKVITNAGARPGDRLVLTKPLGTGVLTTAFKRDLIAAADLEPAVRSMKALNAGAAEAMRMVGPAVHAATDVTGFGLLGHLGNMVRASGVAARLSLGSVPLLPGARESADAGAVPGGSRRNLAAVERFTSFQDGISALDRILLADAQTSGGLLIAVHSARAADLVAALEKAGTPAAVVIGDVTADRPGTVTVTA